MMGGERRPRERTRDPRGRSPRTPGYRRAERSRTDPGPAEQGYERRDRLAAWYDEGFDAFHRSIRTPRLKEFDEIERRRRAGGRREPVIPPHIARRYAPGKSARGYDPRGIHTYDLDYGRQGGGPSEYSGRAGYPTPSAPAYEEWHWSTAEPAVRGGDRRDPYSPGRRAGDRFPRPGGRHRWREPRRRR